MKYLILLPLLAGCAELGNFLGASVSNSPVESIEDHRRRYDEKRAYQKYYQDKKDNKKEDKNCLDKNSPECLKDK